MGYFHRFKQFYEHMYGPPFDDDCLLSESDCIENDDMKLGALGSFYVSEALKLDPGIEVDSAVEMDYAEYKKHFVTVYSNMKIGGRAFRVTLQDLEYKYGKIADTREEFESESDDIVKAIISEYHHVLSHVNPDPDSCSAREDPHEC